MHRSALFGAALTLLGIGGGALVTSHATADAGAPLLRIGGRPVPSDEVDRGLARCRDHAGDLDPARCLDTFLVPLWLLDRKAEDEHLGETLAQKARATGLLHEALVVAIQESVPEPSPSELEELTKAHSREFERPERYRIFRILLRDRKKAEKLLAELGQDVTPEQFRKLARAESADSATRERGGDLGFVWPDGTTDVPELRADPVLYQAAAKVKDGEFVRELVPEGDGLAIVWRRGTLARSNWSADEVRRLVTERLREKKTEDEVRRILDRGRATVQRQDDLFARFKRPDCRLFMP